MSLIHPFFFDTVVALGVPGPDGTVKFTATGFLIGHPVGNNNRGKQEYWVFLVTNRHVVANKTQFMIRLNAPMGASPETYPLPVGRSPEAGHWTFHPDPSVDVAVLVIDAIGGPLKEISLSFVQEDVHATSLEELKQSEFSEGNEVFVLGFPLGLAGQERNYVIVRQGMVARIRDWYVGDANIFLIDSSIFPGNSGGPVIAKPVLWSSNNRPRFTQPKLIGMVSAYLPYTDIAWSLQSEPPRMKMVAEENSGLAEVVPIDAIQETISIAASRYMTTQDTSTPNGN